MDHQTYGAVRRVHSFFPYNVTDARNPVYTVLRRTTQRLTVSISAVHTGVGIGERESRRVQAGSRQTSHVPGSWTCHSCSPCLRRVSAGVASEERKLGAGQPHRSSALDGAAADLTVARTRVGAVPMICHGLGLTPSSGSRVGGLPRCELWTDFGPHPVWSSSSCVLLSHVAPIRVRSGASTRRA